MTVFAAFAMNAIVNSGRRKHQPQPDDEDEHPRRPVLARDGHSETDVCDEQPRRERKNETDLGLHQVAHVRSLLMTTDI
jgi:hypothetical protein